MPIASNGEPHPLLPMTPLQSPALPHSWPRLRTLGESRGLDVDELLDAAAFAAGAHAGQFRRSGEPYVDHAVEVALLVADVGGSTAMVAAALLHDTVEDAGVSVETLRERFGPDVAGMVEGCVKVAAVHPDARDAAGEAGRLRRLFVALAADPRVVVIKLCDRLHNLRTIEVLPPAKAARIGEETLAVHAPLAHRLGLGAIKSELEDRAFAVADPEGFAAVDAALTGATELHEWLDDARTALLQHLRDAGIDGEVSGRVKHRWSVHRKARRLGVTPTELHDLLGLRVLVDDLADCYTALAAVHRLWEPVEGRLKDYLARPKFNAYQSLHTTVFGPDDRRLEVQIRTREMHAIAEHGAAAHHSYKHPGSEPRWLGRLLDWDGIEVSDEEYVAGVRRELDTQGEIYVFSPKGDVVTLPEGAGVLDFAFAVHSEVGNRCVGVKVDGRLVPLDTRLRSGQRVEVMTGPRNGPALDWLDWVVTSKARGRIRQFHARRQKELARQAGRERLTKVLRDAGENLNNPATAAKVVEASGFGTLDALLEAIGVGRFAPTRVLRPAVPAVESAPVTGPRWGDADTVVAMAVGFAGLDLRLAGCCEPAAPAPLRGNVSAGGIAVHRADCPQIAAAIAATPGREVPVFWVRPDHTAESHTVQAAPRPGLLAELAGQVSSVGGELLAVTQLDDDRLRLDIAVGPSRRRRLRAALSLVGGVRSVQ